MVLPNPTATYKALLLNYDTLLAASDQECCYSLSEREIQMLMAFVDYIGWKSRYEATTTEIDQETISHWMGNLARKLMTGCCPDDGSLHRFTAEGVFQTSDDGGLTWMDDPDHDPRNDAIENPPLPGEASDAKKCAAADNVRDLFKQYRDNIISILEASPTLVSIVAGILAFIAVLTGISGAAIGISVLLMGLASFLLTLTPTEVSDQITDDVLDDFRCLVYCRMDQDGRLSYEAWQGLLSDIADMFADFPELFFYQTINAMGYIGVNNAGTLGVATADDCDDCSCDENWCYEYNFASTDGGWTPVYGVYDPGTGWQGTTAGSGVAIAIDKTLSAFTVTHIEMDIEAASLANVAVTIDGSFTINSVSVPTGTYDWDGVIGGTTIEINPSSGAAQGAQVTLTRVLFRGTGANPFGSDNCV